MAKGQKSILTPHQKAVLNTLACESYFAERFYLAGGTALAEFYLKHRISEDLDFFCEESEVDPIAITRFFENKANSLEIHKIVTKRVLGLHSFFLHFRDQAILKVDFSYYPFPRIERGVKYGELEIESMYDIAVDKVHTVALNPRARDYIDLYFIIKEKHWSVKDLLRKAKAKFDWDISFIDFGVRLMEASGAADFPRMLRKIDHRKWKIFFVGEAKKLKEEIFG